MSILYGIFLIVLARFASVFVADKKAAALIAREQAEVRAGQFYTDDDLVYAQARGRRFARVRMLLMIGVPIMLFGFYLWPSMSKFVYDNTFFAGIFTVLVGLPTLLILEYRLEQSTFGAAKVASKGQAAVRSIKHGGAVRRDQIIDDGIAAVALKLNASSSDGALVAFDNFRNPEAIAKFQEVRAKDPWGSVAWRASIEDRALVIGVPGAGKTTFLIAQLVDWMRSGRPLVATDIKPEIWSILKENGIFEKFGYIDYVINPTCDAAHKFNMFAEIDSDAEMNEVLAAIIPSGTADAAVFNDNARRLLKAVMLELGKEASLPKARDYISSFENAEALLGELRNSERKTVQRIAQELTNTAANGRLFGSIMTAMSKAFEFLDDERIERATATSDFSLKIALSGRKSVAVFLQFEQQYKNSVSTLFGGTVAYILRLLQTSAPNRERAVLLALDEIINASPIPKFSETLNTIRSAKMPLCMYLQSIEGLNRVYGPGSDELFMGASDLKVMFRINDNVTAEYVSAQVGDTNISSSSSSSGITSASDRTTSTSSTSTSSSRGRILEPAEMLALEPGKAVVLYRGTAGLFDMPSYWKDYDMPKRAAHDARPQPKAVEVDEAAEAEVA